MRLIIKVLLFLMIFNAMLFFFDTYFPTSQATSNDITGESNYNKYADINNIIKDVILIGGGVFAGTMALGYFVSNLPISQIIGVASMIGVITGLWGGLSSPILQLTKSFGGGIFYNILIICIGVITAFSMIEVFTFKGDAE